MQSASFAVNPGVSQIPSTTSDNHFVLLTYPRAPQTHILSLGGPSYGVIPTDSSQKTNRPETVPMTSKPDIIITDQPTLPQVPPASSFIPESQRNFSQAPRSSTIPPGGETRRAEPYFFPMERATLFSKFSPHQSSSRNRRQPFSRPLQHQVEFV
jgi:hypothetical protein